MSSAASPTDRTLPSDATSDVLLMSNAVLVDGELVRAIVAVNGGKVTSILTADADDDVAPPDEGRTNVGPGQRVLDVGDAPVVPAPLDLHFHGAGGVPVPPVGSTHTLDMAIDRICHREDWTDVAARGFSDDEPYDYLATLPVPAAGPDDIVEHVQAAARSLSVSRRCAGLRLEGLFISPQMAGVWPTTSLQAPDPFLLDELFQVAREEGMPLRVVDVAPELPGALGLITRARELGIVAAIAHTNAPHDQVTAGIDAGATLATHTFNAMRPLHHRDPGVVGAVLTDDRVTCEVICDGVHVHPLAIRLAWRACQSRNGPRMAAISDASPFAGMPPGIHEWAGAKVQGDGRRLVDAHGRLAGSAATLAMAPRVLAMAGLSLREALLAISVVPWRVLDPRRPLGLALGDHVWVVGCRGVHFAHG